MFYSPRHEDVERHEQIAQPHSSDSRQVVITEVCEHAQSLRDTPGNRAVAGD